MARRRLTAVNSPAPHTISSAARVIGCSPSTLRKYERDGIVTPVTTPSGTRIYYSHHIDAAREQFDRRNNKVG